MARLLALVGPLAGFMALAVAFGALGNACAIFIPVFGGYGLLGLAGQPSPITLGTLTLLVILCAVFRGAFRYGEQICNHYIAFKLLADIRGKVFAALRRLCPAKLEGKERGNLITLITTDIELLEVFYAHTISPVALAIIVSVAMTIFSSIFHPLLGLVAACGYITVGIILPLIFSRLGTKQGQTLRNKQGELSSFYLESLRGLPDLLQMGQGNSRPKEILQKTVDTNKIQNSLKNFEGLSSALSGLALFVFPAISLAVSLSLFEQNAISFSAVLIPTIALFSSFGPVLALANLSGNLYHTMAAAERVLALLDEEPEVKDLESGQTPDFTGAESQDLSFSYGNEEILKGLSLDIPKHGITGITGKSGSGKSTFLKLLMRFWNAPKNQLFVSEQEISQISTAHLRKLEGFVTQETDLFHDSIEANIKLGKPDATPEQVVAAAKKASIHGFIASLPNGYDTLVGELGSTLSGGERQRIGLARAFLHDAPLLLLDEPTSNLDSLNEGVILKALLEEKDNRSVVLVSHRRSTMSVADQTYSVENGRVC
ncbi:MAG: ABC transporter ATP-binding protein/permease [Clostridiales bacterium]|nr:ABC transporter ATP-binding protein/permease [Clostridiales bacterium]